MTQLRNDLIDSLCLAIDIARFAPSSHNCQPWQINVISVDNNRMQFDILFEQSRLLTGLPSLNREMYLSCGVFSEYLLQALKYLGFKVKSYWCGDTAQLLQVEAQLQLQSASDKEALARLELLVKTRRTLRFPYHSTNLPEELIYQVKHNFNGNIAIHSGTGTMKMVACLVKYYARLDFSDRKAWSETFDYICFDEKAEREDGFYFSSLFGKTSYWFRWAFRLVLHPTNHRMYSFFGLPNIIAKNFAKLIREDGYVITLTVVNESPKSLFSAGRDLGRISLVVQGIGWSMHPLSVLVQHDEPRGQLSDCLGLNQPLVYVARLGLCHEDAGMVARRPTHSILMSK